jgi:hypothetical protein
VTSFTPVPPGARPSPYEAPSGAPLIEGPRWYRSRIRLWGPLLGLLPPATIGLIAVAALRLSDSAWSGAVGLIGGVLAAPCLLLVGAPFGEQSLYPVAIVASGVLWLLVGLLASRRATRNPMATWPDFWRHYAWVAGGIWVGCVAALGISAAVISDALY